MVATPYAAPVGAAMIGSAAAGRLWESRPQPLEEKDIDMEQHLTEAQERAQYQRNVAILLESLDARPRTWGAVLGLAMWTVGAVVVWAGAAAWLMTMTAAIHAWWWPALPALGWWHSVGLVGILAAGMWGRRIVKTVLARLEAKYPKSAPAVAEEGASSPTGWIAVYGDGSWLPVDRFDAEATPMVYAEHFDDRRLSTAGLVPGFKRLAPCRRSVPEQSPPEHQIS